LESGKQSQIISGKDLSGKDSSGKDLKTSTDIEQF
jgi:hypothetical protein